MLAQGAPDEAIGYLRAFVAAQPDVARRRPARSRSSMSSRSATPTRARSCSGCGTASKDSRDLRVRRGDDRAADEGLCRSRALFHDLKAANYGEPGAVELYLAQIAEETKRYAQAIERYKAVARRRARAGSRSCAIARDARQARQRVEDARRWLADLPAVTIEQRMQVRQAEAQMLRERATTTAPTTCLDAARSNEHPDSPDLLYDIALVAEKLDRIDEAEARLRKRRGAEARRRAGAERARLHARRPHARARRKASR